MVLVQDSMPPVSTWTAELPASVSEAEPHRYGPIACHADQGRWHI